MSDAGSRAGWPTLDEILRMLADFPLHQRLGFELVEAGEGRARARCHVIPEVVNIGGVLHGGVIYAVMDIAAFAAAVTVIPERHNAATADISVQVLRATPPGAVLELTAEVRKLGKRLAFVDAEATLDGEVVALARVTKSVFAIKGTLG